jgi:hypothetical protein
LQIGCKQIRRAEARKILECREKDTQQLPVGFEDILLSGTKNSDSKKRKTDGAP